MLAIVASANVACGFHAGDPSGILQTLRAAARHGVVVGAVLHDADAVAERMLRWVQTGEIAAITGKRIRLQADSICVHGDSPGAVQMAQRIRARLDAAGVPLAPFAG